MSSQLLLMFAVNIFNDIWREYFHVSIIFRKYRKNCYNNNFVDQFILIILKIKKNYYNSLPLSNAKVKHEL